MKSIVILSGPIGAGKTTVARELVALSAAPLAYIEGDTFWSFIAKGDKKQALTKRFKMVMTAMTAASLPYAASGYETILDFSIPPWFLDTARAVAKVREVPLDYVVLRPSEAVCAARAEGPISDYASYRELYASFDGVERNTIRGDASDAKAVAVRIREGLDAGLFRITG